MFVSLLVRMLLGEDIKEISWLYMLAAFVIILCIVVTVLYYKEILINFGELML